MRGGVSMKMLVEDGCVCIPPKLRGRRSLLGDICPVMRVNDLSIKVQCDGGCMVGKTISRFVEECKRMGKSLDDARTR